jgi:hypothetical protein
MAHFAQIDSNNIVLDVLVVPNSEEGRGQEYLAVDLGLGGTWIQTSYNGNFRCRFAGIGMTYDAVNDVFLEPQPYPSWTLDNAWIWQPPVPYPHDGKNYEWDEATLSWVEVE